MHFHHAVFVEFLIVIYENETASHHHFSQKLNELIDIMNKISHAKYSDACFRLMNELFMFEFAEKISSIKQKYFKQKIFYIKIKKFQNPMNFGPRKEELNLYADPQIYLKMLNTTHQGCKFSLRVNIYRFEYGTSFKNKVTYLERYEDIR